MLAVFPGGGLLKLTPAAGPLGRLQDREDLRGHLRGDLRGRPDGRHEGHSQRPTPFLEARRRDVPPLTLFDHAVGATSRGLDRPGAMEGLGDQGIAGRRVSSPSL